MVVIRAKATTSDCFLRSPSSPPMGSQAAEVAKEAKHAGILWLAGFREACSLHRAVVFCARSRPLLIRTGQCFLLNGLIFLGSLFTLRSVVIPILLWILPEQCEEISEHSCDHQVAIIFYSFLRPVLVELFYVFWFYPLYLFSFILSTLWYNDIAKHAYEVLASQRTSNKESHHKDDLADMKDGDHSSVPSGFEGVCLGIGEQVYSILLLTFFFIEVFVTGFIPVFGKAINFLLLSWMYSYYCFEYKWNHSEVSLNRRLNFFQSNWPFFAGFGSPCVLAIFFFSPLVSYGVMAILYPLFVLAAAGSKEEQVIDSLRKSWAGGGPKKIPLFHFANKLSMLIVQILPKANKEN